MLSFFGTSSTARPPPPPPPSKSTPLQCPLCCDSVISGKDAAVFRNCGKPSHACCRDCMSQYIRGLVADGRVNTITCPTSHACGALAQQDDIKRMADSETYAKYDRFCQMQADNTVRQCPDCPRLCRPDRHADGSIVADMRCAGCGSRFCYLHSKAHLGRSCEEYVQEQRRATRKAKRDAQACPICGILTQKSGGCNHMKCEQCKSDWCWQCGKTVENVSLHYSKSNPDGCGQFTDCDFDLSSLGMIAGGVALVALAAPVALAAKLYDAVAAPQSQEPAPATVPRSASSSLGNGAASSSAGSDAKVSAAALKENAKNQFNKTRAKSGAAPNKLLDDFAKNLDLYD